MSFLYLHVSNFSDADDVITTIRLTYLGRETQRQLIERAVKDGVADPSLDGDVATLLTLGAYQLSSDGCSSWDEKKVLESLPDGGDLYAIPAPLRTIYIHGSEQLSDVKVDNTIAWEEASVKMSDARSGVTTPNDLLRCFVAAAPESCRSTLLELFTLSLPDGETQIQPEQLTKPIPWIASSSDYFVIKRAKSISAPKAAAAAAAPQEKAKQPGPMNLAELINMVDGGVKKGLIARARLMVEQYLNQLEDACMLRNETKVTLLWKISELLQLSKKPGQAAERLKEALNLTTAVSEKLKLLKRIGMLYHEARDYENAAKSFNLYIEMAVGSSAAAEAELRDVRIRLGGSLYMSGMGDQAIGIVQSTLAGDHTNEIGVYWMTWFYCSRGLLKDALSWSVQLLVRNSKSPNVKMFQELFVHVIRTFGTEKSIEGLNQIIVDPDKENVDIGNAVGHLALVARDHSLMETSLAIYRKSLRISYTPIIVLNLAHTLENDGKIFEALVEIKKALIRFGPLAVGGVSARDVAALLDLPEGNVDQRYPVPVSTAVQRLKAPRKIIRVHGETEVVTLYDSTASDIPAPAALLHDGNEREGTKNIPCRYSQAELDLIALYFAAVKDMYCLAMVERLPELLHLVNPLRENAGLHRTIIRNETAYLSTVALLMQFLDPCATASYSADMEPLYVIGDSHTFPVSWRSITLREGEKPHLMINALVTGVKLWHLRDESDFYPKYLFNKIVSGLPKHCDVMFMLGEIDCREGVIQTVERGIYNSIDEALEVIGNLYLQVLQKYNRQKQFNTILCHAPPPALGPTRSIVVELNSKLVKMFSRYADSFTYLDLPKLLSVDKSTLMPMFALDGTHLHPRYIELLEQVTQATLPREDVCELTPE